MKIALVSDWFVPRLGGIEMQMRDLALALMARGHDVRVICGVPGEPVVDGIPVERLPGPRLPGFGIAVTPGVFAALRRSMAEGGYDVIHVQAGNVAPIAHHAIQFCIRQGLPAVATFHSVLKYYDAPLWLLDAMHGYSTSKVRFSAVSTVAAGPLKPLLKAAPIGILPNGIDLDWWRRPDDGVADASDRPVEFVSVTRLQKRKRARWLVKAFAEAIAGLPPGSARLTIVGDGDEEAALRRIVAGAGLGGTVVLAGRQPREVIRGLLQRSDVFVLASKLESFGIAALEARASGLPVLTMAQSGARDFLRHGVDALLAEDDRALAADIRAVITDQKLRQNLTEAARTPPAGVDWRDLTVRYEAEYEAAIAAVRQGAIC